MLYHKRYEYQSTYEQTCNTMRGPRYRCTGTAQVAVVRMTALVDDPIDMQKIAIMSDRTGQPVIYNFEVSPQTASVDVASVAHL